MKIVADVLQAADQCGNSGIKTTSLLIKANLSYSRLAKFVKNLTNAGLITRITYDGKNTFITTPRGKQYLKSYKEFSSIAESFGLDL